MKKQKKVLIEIPCEIGSCVYTIYRRNIREWQVVGMWLSNEPQYNQLHLYWSKDKDNFKSTTVPFYQIGVNIFLNEEEAAERLNESCMSI